jgi:transcription elongation factor Elf1
MKSRSGEMPQPGTMSYAQIAAEWVPLRAKGWDLLLQFTCPTCGATSLHSRPNELPPRATCEACGAVVDVEATGGWFAIVSEVESEATERTAAERRRELATHPVDAIADMEAVFAHYDLPTWPIPESFRPALRKPDDWLWTTREIDPMEMYFFRRYLAEATDPSNVDYLAISHAGHGVNSYALSYHLVTGPLGLFAQVLWGGVYADDDRARQRLRRQADLMRRLIPLAEAAATGWDGRRRLIVAESAFRRVAICTWVDLEPPHEIPGDVDRDEALWSIRTQLGRHQVEDPLAEAIRELGGLPSDLGDTEIPEDLSDG